MEERKKNQQKAQEKNLKACEIDFSWRKQETGRMGPVFEQLKIA